jgi:circadian clock protein KaiB
MKTTTATKPADNDTPAGETYRLRLFVSGATPRSSAAIANIRAIGEKRLNGRYELEVIDGYQQPYLLTANQIIVMPTLIKYLPPPPRRIIGDLSDEERVVLGLDLRPEHKGDVDPSLEAPDVDPGH